MNFSVRDCSNIASPYPVDSMTPIYQAAAEVIINKTGIKKGYCLVLGSGQGRLAFELVKRSELIIIGVDDDLNRINAAAANLMKAGLYGSRITLRKVTSLSDLPFTKYFANLVVSERMISDGNCPGSATEMFRVLRPSGGIAYLGQPAGCPKVLTKKAVETWLNAGSVTYTTSNSNGLWSKVVRPPLAGTGWWSHQYADPANSANSNDTLGGATKPSDLQTQWVGRPGADFGVDRHVRMPSPLAKNGRLYHQGLNRIIAMDSYNGAILWSMEIPHLRRVNIGRDGSNLCADDDHLYVAVLYFMRLSRSASGGHRHRRLPCFQLKARSFPTKLNKTSSGLTQVVVFEPGYRHEIQGDLSDFQSGKKLSHQWGGSSSLEPVTAVNLPYWGNINNLEPGRMVPVSSRMSVCRLGRSLPFVIRRTVPKLKIPPSA